MRFPTLLAAVAVFLIIAASSQAADRCLDADELVIMTFNGEFLWGGRQPEEGQVNFSWKGSPDEVDDRMEAIANIIAEHDPDIVNLVEAESLSALQHMNQSFLSERGYVAYLVKGKDTFSRTLCRPI